MNRLFEAYVLDYVFGRHERLNRFPRVRGSRSGLGLQGRTCRSSLPAGSDVRPGQRRQRWEDPARPKFRWWSWFVPFAGKGKGPVNCSTDPFVGFRLLLVRRSRLPSRRVGISSRTTRNNQGLSGFSVSQTQFPAQSDPSKTQIGSLLKGPSA